MAKGVAVAMQEEVKLC